MIPDVVQVVPHDDYTVDITFSDGKHVRYDVTPLLNKGIFQCLKNKNIFIQKCTVLNHTLAWDMSEEHDPTDCIDIDPETLYNHPKYTVADVSQMKNHAELVDGKLIRKDQPSQT